MTYEQACDRLVNQRRSYDEKFGRLLLGIRIAKDIAYDDPYFFQRNWWIQPYDFVGEMAKFINEEGRLELNIRKEEVRSYISLLGLSEHQDEIIKGMNKTARRVTMHDVSQNVHILIHRAILQHDSSALLEFAFSYVDKWKKYHELSLNRWGEKLDPSTS